ncbi:MAG: hypothetical protein M9932_04360 [Xanthobacteraceae bacterium]|nr:hypothetical protein [Xanthobacteraceae bacterium]
MTTPKEALEQIIAIPNRDYGSDWDEIEEAREIARKALASLEGDAVERVELPFAHAINDVLNAMVDAQEEMTTTKISARILSDSTVRAILATGLVPNEAAKCTEISTLRMALEDVTSGITAACVEAEIRADEREKCAKVALSANRQYKTAQGQAHSAVDEGGSYKEGGSFFSTDANLPDFVAAAIRSNGRGE